MTRKVNHLILPCWKLKSSQVEQLFRIDAVTVAKQVLYTVEPVTTESNYECFDTQLRLPSISCNVNTKASQFLQVSQALATTPRTCSFLLRNKNQRAKICSAEREPLSPAVVTRKVNHLILPFCKLKSSHVQQLFRIAAVTVPKQVLCTVELVSTESNYECFDTQLRLPSTCCNVKAKTLKFLSFNKLLGCKRQQLEHARSCYKIRTNELKLARPKEIR